MMPDLDRRQFLTTAGLAGTAMWVAPLVVAVRADAAGTGSKPPPASPRPPSSPPVPQMGPPLATGLPGTLPFTGDDSETLTALGAGTAIAGLALWGMNVEGRRYE